MINNCKQLNIRRAFTLIELLVVIAIIGILSGLIVLSMNASVNSANDAKRKAGIDAIRKALVVEKVFGLYPIQTTPCEVGNNCGNLASVLVPTYFPALPRDPSGDYYDYYSADGISYTLTANLSSGQVYSSSPAGFGTSCLSLLIAGKSVGSGVYTINPTGNSSLQVYCDMTTDGGGWTKVYQSAVDENSSNIQYIAGTAPLIGGSTMMFAYINESNNVLSTPWKFPTPSVFNTNTPMALTQCGYVNITATRISDNSTVTKLLRYGYGSFGGYCDEGCSGTWGQVCLKSNTTQGSAGGYSDFPLFATFAVGNGYDHCSRSDQSYATTQCSTSKRFAIFVR